MTRQRYSKQEAWNRLLRILQGKAIPSDDPGGVTGEVLSENQAISDLAELYAGSLPGESLTFPNALFGSITTTDTIIAGTVDTDELDVGTGTFYAGESEVSVGGFSSNALFGNGKIVLGIGPASSIPSGTLAHLGGVLFAEGGALKWLGSSGTVTTVAGS
jgi:hypothetical protein